MAEYELTESFLIIKGIVLPGKTHKPGKQRPGITQPLKFPTPKPAPMGGDPSKPLLHMATEHEG